jgi:hypothetical protein
VKFSLESIIGAAEAAVAARATAMVRQLMNLILVDFIEYRVTFLGVVNRLGDKNADLLNDLRERQR